MMLELSFLFGLSQQWQLLTYYYSWKMREKYT